MALLGKLDSCFHSKCITLHNYVSTLFTENIMGHTLSEETNTKNIGNITMVARHIQTPMLYNIDCIR